jgi:curli production assembly/transport component CsgG
VRSPRLSAVIGIGLLLSGCATPQEGMFDPVINPVTAINKSLRILPPAKNRVAVAVYEYNDQTGQFKTGENFQTLSRAVTQGGNAILVKALQDAGNRQWFTVIERQQLNNLLKERQIIKEMRRTYLGENGINPQALPPLLFAGVLLEGGIIGFDTNTLTGGAGARYLGIGGDVKYRQDTVTVYLRAVSTKTGEVLLNVTTHKTIASYGIRADAFKFVVIDELLEAEAGITKNEPDQLAVQQAIEKAVYALIMEGSEIGLWGFADPAAQAALLRDYRAEKVDAGHELRAEKPNGTARAALAGEPTVATASGAPKPPVLAQPTKSAPGAAAASRPARKGNTVADAGSAGTKKQ